MTPSQINLYIKYLNDRTESTYKTSGNKINLDKAINENRLHFTKVSNKSAYYEELKKKVVKAG